MCGIFVLISTVSLYVIMDFGYILLQSRSGNVKITVRPRYTAIHHFTHSHSPVKAWVGLARNENVITCWKTLKWHTGITFSEETNICITSLVWHKAFPHILIPEGFNRLIACDSETTWTSSAHFGSLGRLSQQNYMWRTNITDITAVTLWMWRHLTPLVGQDKLSLTFGYTLRQRLLLLLQHHPFSSFAAVIIATATWGQQPDKKCKCGSEWAAAGLRFWIKCTQTKSI